MNSLAWKLCSDVARRGGFATLFCPQNLSRCENFVLSLLPHKIEELIKVKEFMMFACYC